METTWLWCSRTWAHKFPIAHFSSLNTWVLCSFIPSFITSLSTSSLATKGSESSTQFRHMLYITGVSTTSNELWKHFLCIGSAMQPHHSPMCFVIVHIIGPLALTLLTMWTTHFTPLLVTSKWRSALGLECFVKSVTSIAISCWGICAALMGMEDIKFHVVFYSILWHVQTTQQRFINGWVSILPHRLSQAISSLWLLLLLWPIGPSQSTVGWRRLPFFNETFFTFCWTCLF